MTRSPRPAWAKDNDKRSLKGRPWRRLREAVLLRDQYTCRGCGRVCLPSELACDHVVPVAKGGTDDMGNLQTLCDGPGSCHETKTIKENGGKPKQTIGADGWPVVSEAMARRVGPRP